MKNRHSKRKRGCQLPSAPALVNQDGHWVKNGALHKLYLGTIRCHAAGAACDTWSARFCWNNFNRTHRSFKIIEPANSWSYNVQAFRPFNNNSANKVEYVVGLVEDVLHLHCMASTNPNPQNTPIIGIGLDATNTNSSTINFQGNGPANYGFPAHAIFNDYPSLGYHYLAMLERCELASAITFYGDNNLAYFQSGGIGWILA